MFIPNTYLSYRNKIKYLSFLRKRCNVNPARGPFHHRAPRCIFRRTVRGMFFKIVFYLVVIFYS